LNLLDELLIALMTNRYHCLIVKTIAWQDEAATLAFARALAKQPAISDAMIELSGDLGAGKTTFVRHLLGALGVSGRIKSPTYAVVEPYALPPSPTHKAGVQISHFDFYRFNDPREWEEAGFRDIFASPGLKLVEWPEKAGGYLPRPDLQIAIEVGPDQTRAVTLSAYTSKGAELIA
jgi:tRNA threonylcarbamoyladenosine biosynthesis protein TsaE